MPTGRRTLSTAEALFAGAVIVFVLAHVVPATRIVQSQAAYVPLHSLLEGLSIAAAGLVFLVALIHRRQAQSVDIRTTSAFLLVAVIDVLHTLSYPGMPDFFTPSSPEKAINFWLAGRMVAAGAILWLGLRPAGGPTSSMGLAVQGGVVAVAAALIGYVGLFRSEWLPRTYVPGQGLTTAKVVAEYAIIAVNLAGALVCFKRERIEPHRRWDWLAAAGGIMVLAELFLTLYVSTSDLYNLMGHLYKVLAYACVLYAMAGRLSHGARPIHEVSAVEKFKARYTLVLIALGMLSLFAYINLSGLIEAQASSGAAINIAGRQRALSQRIGLLAERFADEQDLLARATLRGAIAESAERMLRSHEALIHGDRELGLVPLQWASVRALYFGPDGMVDRDVRNFLALLKEFVGRHEQPAGRDHDHFRAWSVVANDPLLQGLDRVTRQLQTESEQLTAELRNRALGIGGLTIVVLTLSGFGVFRPIVRKVEGDMTQLAATQGRLQGIIDGALDAIIAIDDGGRVIEFNPSASAIFGYAREQAIGADIAELIIPAHLRDAHRRALERFTRTRTPTVLNRRLELPAVRADGSSLLVELAIVQNTRTEGTVFTAFLRDITEQKRQDEWLRKLSQAVEQSPVSVVITDLGGTIEYVNKKFESVTGYKREEAVGQNPRILKSGDKSSDDYRKMWSTILAGGEWQGEFTNKRKDGTVYHENAQIGGIRGPDGTLSHFLAVKEDITEKRTTEIALRRSQKMDAIGKLSGGLAHDFNNILGIISGNLEILKRMIGGNAKAIERLDVALRSVQRAATLTKRLLRFSRQQPQNQEAVSVSQVINDMRELLARSLTNQIELKMDLAPDVWLTELDPGDLEDTLVNLAINARDAMPEGGQLHIETRNVEVEPDFLFGSGAVPPGSYVLVSVSDTGTGMSREIIERIFEPFYSTKPKDKGTGLGLSMVYGFIKRSKAHITVYSEEGVGTRFRLYFLRSDKNETTATFGAKPVVEVKGGVETILVVDDEAELAAVAGSYLEGLGYRVLLADSGHKALTILGSEPVVDLVVSDVVMPGGINGFELLDEIAKRFPRTRVMLTSGFTDNLEKLRGAATHDISILAKPYNLSELAIRARAELDAAGTVKN